MKIRRMLVSSLAIFALVFGAAIAQGKEGKDTVKLTTAKAYQENGSPAPSKDAACAAKYKTYIGASVTNTYNIDTKSQTASSNFQNVDTKLIPMGLSSSYSFISNGIPPELQKIGVMRIIFQISRTFTSPKNMVMFPLETGFNCALSNGAFSAAAAKAALTAKPKE